MITQQKLKEMGKAEALKLKDRIKVSDASIEEKERALTEIEVFINGGVNQCKNKAILEDIEASQPDYSDIGGMN